MIECVIVALVGLGLTAVEQFDIPAHHGVRPVEIQGSIVVHQLGSGVGQQLQDLPITVIGGQFYRVPPAAPAEGTYPAHAGSTFSLCAQKQAHYTGMPLAVAACSAVAVSKDSASTFSPWSIKS